MGCIHKQEIDTAASWHAADFVGDQSWLVHFTDAEMPRLITLLPRSWRAACGFQILAKMIFRLQDGQNGFGHLPMNWKMAAAFCWHAACQLTAIAMKRSRLPITALHLGQPVDLLGVVMNVGDRNVPTNISHRPSDVVPVCARPNKVVSCQIVLFNAS